MAHTETAATLFELAIAAEEQLESFYRELTEKFERVPAVSVVWNAVADDERKHAETLANIRDSLPPNVLSSEEDPAQVRKAREVLRAITDCASDSVKTLEDAYQLAHGLENSGVNMVFTILVEQYSPSDGRLDLILPAIEIHLERLRSFSRLPDSHIWRKGIPAMNTCRPASGRVGPAQSWPDVPEPLRSA
jgi:hypothetical protein